MSKHTPAPWVIQDFGRSPMRLLAKCNTHDALALVYVTDPKTRRRTPEYAANARVIAEAPTAADLLRDWLYAHGTADDLSERTRATLRRIDGEEV